MTSYSQNKEIKQLLSRIEGKWQKDDNGNVTYTKVIENINLPKDSIYNRALKYCIINYHYGKYNYFYSDDIVVEDKEKGRIIAKGFYRKTYVLKKPYLSGFNKRESVTNINTMHALKIEIKNKRVIVLLTLTEYDYSLKLSMVSKNKKFPVTKTFPVNPKRNKWKNIFGEAFYESHQKVQKSLLDIETTIREGLVEKEKYEY